MSEEAFCKEHCRWGGRISVLTPCLQFNKTGFDQNRKYVVIWMEWTGWIQSSKTGDQQYNSDTSPHSEFSLLFCFF